MPVFDFTKVYRMLDNAARLNEDDAWLFALGQDFTQSEIVRLNQEQLYEEGMDAKGFSLGVYSQFTINIKRQKGQRYDHVTLRDTGEFYSTFHVIVYHDAFEIDANDEKDGKALFEVYGEDVMGLTDFNKSRIKEVILNYYLEYARNTIFQ